MKPSLWLAAIALVIAGCNSQQVRQSGVMGTNAEAGDVLLRSVHVEAPTQPRYQSGDSPIVWLTLLNGGSEPDTLVEVSTPYASSVEIRWDRGCDGTAETVPQLPLRPTEGTAEPTGAAPPFDNYHLRIVQLDREVLAGMSIPLTFQFARAGEVSLDAPIQPRDVPRAEPSTRCAITQ